MNTYGGFGQYISIPADWAISLPKELSEAEAMSIGTAGLTAGLCVRKLLMNDLAPDSGDVLVTGASGGVGSVAVMILSKLGFRVTALTGKTDQIDYLESLGASSIIMRNEMEEQGKPLQKGLYQGGVDTVGGSILSNFISQTSQRGAITCCGNVAGDKLQTSVFPFILRGVSLIGIDSAESLLEVKKEVWNNFSKDWKIDLEKITKEVRLDSLSDEVEKILKGEQVGRIRVNLG
jgi:putative YhdH/YhfP family quinone oxidoreductase